MMHRRTVRQSPGWLSGLAIHRPPGCKPLWSAALALRLLLLLANPASGVTLWSDPGATLTFNNGAGRDILGGAVKRDDASADTLYFRFRINPQSDSTSEEYCAGFELYEGDAERLGIGNALKAWAYSVFFRQDDSEDASPAPSYLDLHSSILEPARSGTSPSYELPHRGVERTVVFKVQYVAGGDDLVTVWLNPDLSSGANEIYQPESLTTRFNANAAFDEVRLRHGGAGSGWLFSEMAIATSFNDFVDTSSAKPVAASPIDAFAALAPRFQSWQRESGMPRAPIRALAQTRDGYLWLGTDDGLARFDGVRFTSFDLKKLAGSPGVRALVGDSLGALWLASAGGGLVRYADGEFSTLTATGSLAGETVTGLTPGDGGRLWVGTERGLAAWQDGKLIAPAPGTESLRDHAVSALCTDKAGALWLGVAKLGVFRYETNRLTAVTAPGMEALLSQPHCLLVDRSGRLWVGAGDDFVLCRENGQWRRFRIPRHSVTPFVTSLAEEPDGTVWAGSASEGLFQFKGGKLSAVSTAGGLADNHITSLFVDRDGKLWAGSSSGLSGLRRNHLFALGQNEGLGYGPVHGLAEVAPGVVWAARSGDGLYRWEGGAFNRLSAAGVGARDSRLGAMLVTRDGNCWLGVTNGLLLFRDPQAVADDSWLLELTNASISALAEDAQGGVLAGSRQGALFRLAEGQWSQLAWFRSTNGVTALVPEPDGSLWVGTDGAGLFHGGKTGTVHYEKNSGLPGDVVRTLHRDGDGSVWIGTDGGLGLWRAGKLSAFTTQHGLPENNILQIQEDDAGRLWLGGSRGITCVRKQGFGGEPVFPHLYGRSDGMPSEECSTGFFPSGLKTRSGLLWFATLNGVVVADPKQLPTRLAPPTVLLEEILVDGMPAPGLRAGVAAKSPAAPLLRIPPGKHRLELSYTTVNFEAPDQLHFRYQLEGLDPAWVEAGPQRTAFYSFVPPGEYRFRVSASIGGQPWSQSEARLGLAVSRQFWQRGWVLLLAALGLLAGVGAGARLVEKRRSQRRLQRLEQQRALEHERRRIAQDLHDEMGAKLCRISFLSEHAQRHAQSQGEVRDQITTIAGASRELLHSLDEIVWAVNPQNDTVEHVASYINQYAQDYFQGTGIACELDMPDQFEPHPVSSQARHHLFRAVHEAFTNILKHSGATRARLTMACAASAFEVRVEDNGKGFSRTETPRSQPGGNASGDGLRNMRHRLESVGGHCRLESIPGQGTTLWFSLPLTYSPKRKVPS